MTNIAQSVGNAARSVSKADLPAFLASQEPGCDFYAIEGALARDDFVAEDIEAILRDSKAVARMSFDSIEHLLTGLYGKTKDVVRLAYALEEVRPALRKRRTSDRSMPDLSGLVDDNFPNIVGAADPSRVVEAAAKLLRSAVACQDNKEDWYDSFLWSTQLLLHVQFKEGSKKESMRVLVVVGMEDVDCNGFSNVEIELRDILVGLEYLQQLTAD